MVSASGRFEFTDFKIVKIMSFKINERIETDENRRSVRDKDNIQKEKKILII